MILEFVLEICGELLFDAFGTMLCELLAVTSNLKAKTQLNLIGHALTGRAMED